MNIGEYKMVYQKGARAYYGYVKVGVSKEETDSLHVLSDDKIDFGWRFPLTVAVETAARLVKRQAAIAGVRIQILEFAYQEVMTTEDVLKFIVSKAVFSSLAVNSENFSFDLSTGVFRENML